MRPYFPLHRQIVVGLGNGKMVLNEKTTVIRNLIGGPSHFFNLRNKSWKPE